MLCVCVFVCSAKIGESREGKERGTKREEEEEAVVVEAAAENFLRLPTYYRETYYRPGRGEKRKQDCKCCRQKPRMP